MEEEKRLFLGGLSKSVQEKDVKVLFSKFGEVSKVNIITKENVSGQPTNIFAFVDIHISALNLTKCLKIYNNTKWKGNEISVQVAKENFLDRLKKEKEERQKEMISHSVQNMNPTSRSPVNINKLEKCTQNINDKLSEIAKGAMNQVKISGYKRGHTEFSTSLSIKNFKLNQEEKITATSGVSSCKSTLQEDLISGSSTDFSENDGLYSAQSKFGMKKFCGTKASSQLEIKDKYSNKDYLHSKHTESNKKRLESLQQRTEHLKIQQNAIKAALNSIDCLETTNNKIVFDMDEDEHIPDSNNRSFTQDTSGKKSLLFTDSENDDSQDDKDMFKIKHHFEGKKGQKLIALQSHMKNDERFQLDERFLESEDESIDHEDFIANNDEQTKENEKQKYLTTLQNVLKVQLPNDSERKTVRNLKNFRFDPTKPDSLKFELKEENKGKNEKKTSEKGKSVEELQPVEVSKEKFYSVSSSLKDAMANETQFSLLKTFGKNTSIVDSSVKDDYITKTKTKTWESNPFKYDSSEEEEDSCDRDLPTVSVKQVSLVKQYSFFLKPDDERLKGGIEFFRRHDSLEDIYEKWENSRPSLMELLYIKRKISRQNRIYAKNRNSQKRNFTRRLKSDK